MARSPSQALRDRWLQALLPNVPFDGWTSVAAKAAAREAGLSEAEQALAAPRGIEDLVDAFFDAAEAGMKAELEKTDMAAMGVRARVRFALKAWLHLLAPNREAVRRAAARGFLPWHAGAATFRTWSVADAVWTGIGDTSEDYNRYTKRGILAAIIPAVILYWLDEEDETRLDTYLEKRLTRAMKIGQAGGKVFGPVLSLFSSRNR